MLGKGLSRDLLAPHTVGAIPLQSLKDCHSCPNLCQIQQRDTYYLQPQVPVGGQVSLFFHFWQLFTNDQWDLHVVKHGYCLEFAPPPLGTGRRKTVLLIGECDTSKKVT